MTATVLIVDDEIHIRRLISQVLELAGFRVIEADSGAEALRLAQAAKPDIITCYIFMPGMSGFEVLEAIKAQPDTADIPVIMLTAMGQEKNTTRAVDLGAADYITKPFGSAKLIETIERHLSERQDENKEGQA